MPNPTKRVSLTFTDEDLERLKALAQAHGRLSRPKTGASPRTTPGLAARGIVRLALAESNAGQAWPLEAIGAAADQLRRRKRGERNHPATEAKATLVLSAHDERQLRRLAAEGGTTPGIAARGIIVAALDAADAETDLGDRTHEAVEAEIASDRKRRAQVGSAVSMKRWHGKDST